MKNCVVTIHIVPFVDASNSLHLQDPTVDVNADLHISVGDAYLTKLKKKVIDQIRTTLVSQLQKPAVKQALEKAIAQLFLSSNNKTNANINGFQLDSNGMAVSWSQ
jgi:hypothetical protein